MRFVMDRRAVLGIPLVLKKTVVEHFGSMEKNVIDRHRRMRSVLGREAALGNSLTW